jgi:hypothetical protein
MRIRSKTAIKDREKENDIKKQERKRDGEKASKKECKPERREYGLEGWKGGMPRRTKTQRKTNKGTRKETTEA